MENHYQSNIEPGDRLGAVITSPSILRRRGQTLFFAFGDLRVRILHKGDDGFSFSDDIAGLGASQFAELSNCWRDVRETVRAFYQLDAARRDGNLNERSLYRYVSPRQKQLLLGAEFLTPEERELLEKDIHY